MQQTGSFINEKSKTQLGRTDFCRTGYHILYLDMAPTMDHGEHTNHEPTVHSVTLLSLGEMTWRWFTMALVHFFK